MPEQFKASISLMDKAEQSSTVEFYVSEAAVTGFVADPTAAGAVKAILDAVADVSLATDTARRAWINNFVGVPVPPTDDQAYRSSKLIVYFIDDVTFEPYTVTIPARDTAKYNTYPGSKNVILTVAAGGTAEIEALVTALNTNAKSKAGNAITVSKIQIAGRSS